MNKTKIEYLDYNLNIVVGCNGRGCAVRKKCWARAQAKRKKHYCPSCYNFSPHFHIERLKEPFKLKKPSRIGLNFMGDTFDYDLIDNLLLNDLFDMIEKTDWHTFILLTKQPQNISKGYNFSKNLWLGVSINKQVDLWRIEQLKKTQVKVKFVSFEPLYEDMGDIDLEGMNWIIIGAQTRPNLQPEHRWVDKLFEEAKFHSIPVFLKNNLSYFHILRVKYSTHNFQEFPKQ